MDCDEVWWSKLMVECDVRKFTSSVHSINIESSTKIQLMIIIIKIIICNLRRQECDQERSQEDSKLETPHNRDSAYEI